jgi:hypothetical protein
MPSVQQKRGTRAQINAAAAASGLNVGEIYLIIDENRLAIGTAANAYQDFAKKSELSDDGVWMLTKQNSAVLANTTALQKMFDVTTNGAMILNVGLYIFDLFFQVVNMATSTGNALISMKGAGTANIIVPLTHAVGIDGAVDTLAPQTGKHFNDFANTGNLVTSTTNTTMFARVHGTFYNATEGGTIIPSIGLTTATSGANISAISYCMVRRVTTSISQSTRGNVS